MSEVKDKKSKKDKKRKHEESAAGEEETAGQPVAMTDEAEPEPEVKKSKKEKKAKKQKREAAAAAAAEEEEEEEDSAPAAKASTSNALNALADELVVTKNEADEEEPIDLLALKSKNKSKTKMVMHASRLGDAPKEEEGFKVDPTANVNPEPVRIFIGNLPFKITEELLHEAFDEFGTIVGIHWVTDKATGQFYGTGFIDFETPEAAKAALVRNGVEILGRPIKVNFATGANVQGKNRFQNKQKKGGHLAALPISEKPEGCNTVFLGNLSFQIDEPTIRDVFKECGEISDVRWVEKDGEFKGCGFVEFVESWSTDEAVKLNGSDVLGRPMRVDYSARGSR